MLTEHTKRLTKEKFNTLSIPYSVISLESRHGVRCVKTDAQREFNQAKDCSRRRRKEGYTSILRQFKNHDTYRETELASGWTEDTGRHWNQIANEENSYIATWYERQRYDNNCRNAPMTEGRLLRSCQGNQRSALERRTRKETILFNRAIRLVKDHVKTDNGNGVLGPHHLRPHRHGQGRKPAPRTYNTRKHFLACVSRTWQGFQVTLSHRFFVFLNTVILTSACHVAHLAWSFSSPRLHSALRPLPLCSSFRTGHILVHHNQDSRLAVVANRLRSHFDSRQDLASIVFTPRVSETASLCRASVADDLSDFARTGGTSQKTWWTCAVMSDHSLSSWYRDHSRTFVGRCLQREQRVCPQQVTWWRFLPFRQSHVFHSTLVVDHPHCMHDHLQKKKISGAKRAVDKAWEKLERLPALLFFLEGKEQEGRSYLKHKKKSWEQSILLRWWTTVISRMRS